MPKGDFTHIEFPAEDVERAKRFYGELFGWTFREFEGMPGYYLFDGGPGNASGAIGKRGEAGPQDVLVYMTVDSIDESLVRAEELGATILTPSTQVPDSGWFAVIDDGEGNRVGFWQDPPA